MSNLVPWYHDIFHPMESLDGFIGNPWDEHHHEKQGVNCYHHLLGKIFGLNFFLLHPGFAFANPSESESMKLDGFGKLQVIPHEIPPNFRFSG